MPSNFSSGETERGKRSTNGTDNPNKTISPVSNVSERPKKGMTAHKKPNMIAKFCLCMKLIIHRLLPCRKEEKQ